MAIILDNPMERPLPEDPEKAECNVCLIDTWLDELDENGDCLDCAAGRLWECEGCTALATNEWYADTLGAVLCENCYAEWESLIACWRC